MIGVVRTESYFSLTKEDAQFGIEADRRTNILREFVRNTYTYHQPEILATIINEYTDWERAVQHPVNIRRVLITSCSSPPQLSTFQNNALMIYVYILQG